MNESALAVNSTFIQHVKMSSQLQVRYSTENLLRAVARFSDFQLALMTGVVRVTQ